MTISNALADLAERVREAHEASATAERTSIEKAIEAGHLLIEAKDTCAHSDWLFFLARAAVAERKAQRLMQIAHSGLKPDTVSGLGGIKGTIAYLAARQLPDAGKLLFAYIRERARRRRIPGKAEAGND